MIDDIEGLLYKTTDRALKELKEKITSILSEMKTKAYQTADYPVIVSLDDVSTSQINEYLEQLKKNIPKISPTEQNPNPKQDPLINKINEIIMHVRTISISEKVTQAEDEIWNMRPTIVTFSSFGDTLPDQVPFLEFTNPDLLKKNRPIVHDLIKLSDLDVTKLQNNNKLKRQNLTDIAAGISSQKFSEFWKQNPIEFVFDVDNESASIFIRDKGKTFSYKPEQRSEGFQWFLSFFLRLEATGREKNNLILVDEPGLYLHFRAQKDVLAVFTKLAENNQIIFTTHSPYLIDPENLNQVRLVRKHDDKSIIQNNFHEGGTDADTLTPIITALDLDLTKDLFFNRLGYNIVVEGVSDYYYLHGILKYLKKVTKYDFPDNITFIPCVGNANMGIMVSFLMALGLKYKILFDKKGTTKTANKLERDGIKKEQIFFAGKSQTESIEDLFDEIDKKNNHLDTDGISKGIIARTFYEEITSGTISLEKITMDNFTSLFNELKKDIMNEPDNSDIVLELAKDLAKEIKEKIKESKTTLTDDKLS